MTTKQLVLGLMIAVGACGGNQARTTQTSVDTSTTMAQLSATDQAILCADLSSTLTEEFGSRDVACKFSSSGGSTDTCESRYASCEQTAPAQSNVSACSSKNVDMFQCSITVGEYIACFDALNMQILDTLNSGSACHLATPTSAAPAECTNAQCDYVWFD